jgi:hypothetical protein
MSQYQPKLIKKNDSSEYVIETTNQNFQLVYGILNSIDKKISSIQVQIKSGSVQCSKLICRIPGLNNEHVESGFLENEIIQANNSRSAIYSAANTPGNNARDRIFIANDSRSLIAFTDENYSVEANLSSHIGEAYCVPIFTSSFELGKSRIIDSPVLGLLGELESGDIEWTTADGNITISASGNLNLKGSVCIGTGTPIRQLHQISPTGSCEFVMEVADGLANWRKWNFFVNGGTGNKQDFALRILNDAGAAGSVYAMGWLNSGDVLAYHGLHVGGSSAPGDNNLLVDGTVTSEGNILAKYGLHVGGTSDPGDNNLFVDGKIGLANTGLRHLLAVGEIGVVVDSGISAVFLNACAAADSSSRAVFLNVAPGYGEVLSYNYSTGTWQNMCLARAGTTAKVGILTNDPQAPLDVAGVIRNRGITIYDAGGLSAYLDITGQNVDGTDYIDFLGASGKQVWITAQSSFVSINGLYVKITASETQALKVIGGQGTEKHVSISDSLVRGIGNSIGNGVTQTVFSGFGMGAIVAVSGYDTTSGAQFAFLLILVWTSVSTVSSTGVTTGISFSMSGSTLQITNATGHTLSYSANSFCS